MLKNTVSKVILFSVLALSGSAFAQELPDRPTEVLRQLEVSWTAPTTRENGSALPQDEIGGYEIYAYKDGALTDPIVYRIEDKTATSYHIDDLAPADYRFALRIFDTDGLFSDPTPFVDVVVDLKTGPSAPTMQINLTNPLTDAVAWCGTNKNCGYELKFKIAGVE